MNKYLSGGRTGLVAIALVVVTALVVIAGALLGVTRSVVWRAFDSTQAVLPPYQWRSTACWFEADYQRDIVCGQLQVQVVGGEFLLPVVIIKDESEDRRADPVIYLNGGPGVGIGLHESGIKKWLAWLRLADLKRDLILMDGRGLGRAQPALNCEMLAEFNRDLLRKPLPLAEERSRNREIVRECLEMLATRQPALTPENFGSAQSAQDIIGLMQALSARFQYPKYNLVAVSYGTRLALEVERLSASLAQNPLNAMLLDSVYPAGEGGVATLPDVAGAAFANFFDGCSEMPECSGEFAALSEQPNPTAADIEKTFLHALTRLTAAPVDIVLRPHEDEVAVNFKLTDARFLAASFARSYSVAAWPDIARATRSLLEGGHDELKLFVALFLRNTFNSDYNELAFILTDCRDNGLGDVLAFNAGQAHYPQFAHFFAQDLAQQTCQDFHALAPLALNPAPQIPALMISGEDDPITPINWAVALRERWRNGYWITVPGQGHAVLSEQLCWLEYMRSFFDAAGSEIESRSVQQAQEACAIRD